MRYIGISAKLYGVIGVNFFFVKEKVLRTK